MASEETWNKVRAHFRPDSKIDNWGDVDGISDEHLLRLYDFRVWVGTPIFVLHAVKTSGHAKKSYHYGRKDENGVWTVEPCATDIILPDYQKTPFDLILDAQRFGFTGIGYYPHWRYNGQQVGGLHVDSRPLKWDRDLSINYRHSRWMGIKVQDENDEGKYKQEYIAMTFHNILKYSKGVE